MTDKKSIIPPTGDFGTNWTSNFVIPQGASGNISAGGWTYTNEGFVQQTFLGASIRSFNVGAGFGDTSSTLSIQLVEDEYNKSDEFPKGQGDDPYHNGVADKFIPPPVGSPVFFKFGKNFATIEQAWRKTFDDTYGYSTLGEDLKFDKVRKNNIAEIPEYHYLDIENTVRVSGIYEFIDESNLYDSESDYVDSRGRNHFVFGGILQSYTQNKGSDGNPVYSVQVVDPREILSNTIAILNSYAGSIFNNKNYFNVYGFLEYDPSDGLKNEFQSLNLPGFNFGPFESDEYWSTTSSRLFGFLPNKTNNILEKVVDPATGQIYYFGNDMYRFTPPTSDFVQQNYPEFFPITGQGFSRRCEQGIPWYRVRQALNTLFNYNGLLPQEYVDKGFGGAINFRGFNYVVDFSGIPIEKIPQMYFLEFDQIDLLSLCQELCDIISHDLFVSLIPVIDHPGCKFLHNYNKYQASVGNNQNIIAGIIRVDAIDRSQQPEIGAIKSYLEDLEQAGIKVENKDLGYELSNITTDKMVVGAQEVEMYYFTNNRDRDHLQLKRLNAGMGNDFEVLQEQQWLLDTSLSQQILPFYGFLGKNTVTIPRGFGSYQQIMLDTSGLDAYGVGNYYIATEIELRSAAVSYEQWAKFLLQYNEVYIEEIGDNYIFYKQLESTRPNNEQEYCDSANAGWLCDRDFAVSVPRCVYVSERNYLGPDGYPASPCCPPFGYPLYYKRAEKVGVPEAGIAKFNEAYTATISRVDELRKLSQQKNEMLLVYQQEYKNLLERMNSLYANANISKDDQSIIELQKLIKEAQDEKINIDSNISNLVVNVLKYNSRLFQISSRLARRHIANAKKVHAFIKNIADTYLGKKFLVKIPKQCNLFYNPKISLWPGEPAQINNIKEGPFGFRALPIYSQAGYYNDFNNLASLLTPYGLTVSSQSWKNHYLDYTRLNTPGSYTYGALKGNFNPISDRWEFNYIPEPQGGFFNYSIYDRSLSLTQALSISSARLPYVQSQLLAPLDLSNFENDGRISAYVRYDHSEILDLSAIPNESLAQQVITPNGFIPDVIEELDNTDPNNKDSYELVNGRIVSNDIKPPSVAFIKCEIDPELYMIPTFSVQQVEVFARLAVFKENRKSLTQIEVLDANGCPKLESARPYAEPIFFPNHDGFITDILDFNRVYNPNLDAFIINTEKQALNSDHVYAIITLPDKVVPTVQTRYNDSMHQSYKAGAIKHILTQDVVRMPLGYGFDKPAPWISEKRPFDCSKYSYSEVKNAMRIQNEVFEAITYANPELELLTFNQSSPVYPDLVVLPLMSMERCYGPWVSSSIFNGQNDTRIRYSDIGGKVEFVKDEELAPWKYGGYQLMNEAGSLQAQFSNSLLLFSERGGFVIPDAPMGISLAKTLKDNGPLVTSMSIDINDRISTTVRMDLYTSRFGKLQKQKEDAIAKIVRERQKIIDQNNLLSRQGLKNRLSKTMLVTPQMNATINYINSSLEKGTTVGDKILLSVVKNTQNAYSLSNPSQTVQSTSYHLTGSVHPNNGYTEETFSLINDEATRRRKYSETAGATIPQLFTPVNKLPLRHDVNVNTLTPMAGVPYMNQRAVIERVLGQ